MIFSKQLTDLSLKVFSSVSPQALLAKHVKCIGNPVEKLLVPSLNLEVDLAGRVFVIGFGKGAFELAYGLQNLLPPGIVTSGILSVPEGCSDFQLPPVYRIIKAAPSNIPDANSVSAGELIVELMSKLKPNDVLIALITGGGSALVTCPVPPVSIENLSTVVKSLQLAGAPIEDLNAVRQHLDILKAGGMAVLSYPSRVLSFILSDVIGSNIDVIASGPTSLSQLSSNPIDAIKIFQKYDLLKSVPQTVYSLLNLPISDSTSKLSVLRRMSRVPSHLTNLASLNHVSNVLIGSNLDAIHGARTALEANGIPSITYEENYSGDASKFGQFYAKLGYLTCRLLWNHHKNGGDLSFIDENIVPNINSFRDKVTQTAQVITLPDDSSNFLAIALVSGGETTVVVNGSGKGGRNQEAALAASIALNSLWKSDCENSHSFICNILFLATDGQDGPTDASGAVATPEAIDLASKANLSAVALLNNNDSYSFWSALNNGAFHVRTGRSGTNVADVAVLIAAIRVDKSIKL